MKDFYKIDFFHRYHREKINIIVSDNSEIKVNMFTSSDIKMEDFLRANHIRLQIYGKYLLYQ